ncbi:DNA-binding anti-repressor SinI [Bacillus sp. B1-b2]|nr:DNA-binding anti-repressor SinI [Bacillus sp. B1-b2]
MQEITMTEFDLDREWVELMQAAKRLGISLDEIRDFLSVKQKDQ